MSYPSGGYAQPLFDPRNWSYRLMRVAGVTVRMHLLFVVMLVLVAVYTSWQGKLPGLMWYGIPAALIIAGIVLLHEFGHIFGCRAVGGEASEILMWPLGGLAYCRPPHRPWESLVTVVAGPAVNVAILAVTTPVLLWYGTAAGDVFYPFAPPVGLESWSRPQPLVYVGILHAYSYLLLLFNLLPVYPLDGGQIVRDLFWFRVGFHKATKYSCYAGLVAGGIMFVVALWTHYPMVALIGLFCCFNSWAMLRNLAVMGEMPENEFGYDFSQGYTSLDRSMGGEGATATGPSLRQRVSQWRKTRESRKYEGLGEEMDRILAKITDSGMASLTRAERRTLTLASKAKRMRG